MMIERTKANWASRSYIRAAAALTVYKTNIAGPPVAVA
jgi:hypothetical protein